MIIICKLHSEHSVAGRAGRGVPGGGGYRGQCKVTLIVTQSQGHSDTVPGTQ